MSETHNTYRLFCLSEAVSPITHAMGTAGNESIIARERVITPAGDVELPFLSGNALRHRCIREPGVLWLIQRYDLRGRLSIVQLNFLLHGGSLTESTASENTRRIAEFQRFFPLLRLTGGCLPNQMLAGSMDAWRGTLVCEENRPMLSLTLPEGVLPKERLRPAEQFAGDWQYTRSDAGKLGIAAQNPIVPNDEENGKSNLMIYSGQAVRRGAMFAHGFLCKHATAIELGALLLSLRLWQSAGGTIGGQAAKGHGRLHTWLYANEPLDQEALVNDYIAYADAVRDDAVAWLWSVFARPAKDKKEKPAKGRKSKTAEPEQAELPIG